ncbi:S1C family serine protease [Clostridium intestinale]|uniref:S1C family serine protease n=1 Tax=Clostridium intestinale TaxID=36845 RepID=UPI002DD63692|nr:trypsin-like peptidase domain-containing protein [Clostridium intestinale]WRY49931.1 trypsin-like peptidase domain-containing protein [Clostridium intestinale]
MSDFRNGDSENGEIYSPNFVMIGDGKNKKGKNKKEKGNGIGKYLLVGLVTMALTLSISIPSTYYIIKTALENGTLKGTSETKNISYTTPSFTSNTTSLSVTDVVNKVAPAVVSVSTKSSVSNGFFNQPQEGVGSGFIINEDGDILTNYHVVQGATEVNVTFNNGKEYKAKIVNYDANADLAMIRLVEKVEVPGVATLGDSDLLQAGQEVIAIGNPLGKEFVGTVTKGIVSAASRSLQNQDGSTSVYIQTDAAINPGNSGGPLINANGEVIGINSAKISEAGVEGIGFSIPINSVKDKIGALSKQSLTLGVSIRDLDSTAAKQYKLVEGIYVASVVEYSPAEKAGIKAGDVIVGFNGKNIKTSAELSSEKNKLNEGDKVKIVVNRDGKEVTLEITMSA